ncbi:urease accessory protein UreF [Paracoccus sp. 11-3]|uniref:Urease accessory protein UreF n=1 Tax=Paracoccus amoyensis TaxID=2760093 RepID=A0A926JCQ7_9RHOB|nr:urease accessory UreF family protein [Paracoccus amoyensis]MBC9246639.1 urease accessory protein UreF [Paracoccus amoyensis]
MTTPDAARLRIAQYLSPAFPVGGFAWSQGLEWAMDRAEVTRTSLPQWLADWLDYGAGWTDAVLVALSLRPEADHGALNDLAHATCVSAERLTETTEQGAAFTANITALTGVRHKPAALPVAFGRACVDLPLPHAEIIAAYLQAQVCALISAAIRFMPLGPVEGQMMLTALQPAMLHTASRAANANEDDLASVAWGADIAAMHHETMSVRIFRS